MSEFDPISDIGSPKPDAEDVLTDSLYETSVRVRKVLQQDLAECRFSRDEVARRLSVRMGRISVAIIDAYVAHSKPHRFPAELIPAWIEVTGSRRILDLLCGEVGLSIANEEDRDFAAFGRAHLKAAHLQTKLAGRI